MEKLKMHTPDKARDNFEKLAVLFPNAVTETITGYDENGKAIVERAIDADVLRQEISTSVVEGAEERYQFTWPDKKKAILLANSPIAATLRPCREESVDFDNTENLYIEGDNLDVLKLMLETYLGKVKMIYIDPPYNTGNDFIYNDDFTEAAEDFLARDSQYDDEGNRMVKNLESNGRFHTDWLNMVYPRLRLARDLLRDDGVIFISISDGEIDNLRKICDEVFGANNFAACIPWQSRLSIQNDTDFSVNHEYIVVYAKKRRVENRRLKESNISSWYNKDSFVFRPLPLDREKFSNPDNDPRGAWKADPFDAPGVRENLTYVITNPNTGEECLPPIGRHWRTEEKNYLAYLKDKRIVFGKTGNSRPQLKVFYNEKKDFGSIENSWFSGDKVGTATAATKELQQIFNNAPFDTPKPTILIKKLCDLGFLESGDIILDFFSGSATTAHAVMQLNADDGGNRKFIMVQVPELTDENSEAYKAGYRNICEIGKERIRRAGRKIKEENPLTTANLDIGFRVLKLDSSNMKDVYYTPDKYEPSLFESLTDNIKEDRTPEDLLFQVMLELGVLLSSKIEKQEINGMTVFSVAEGYLIACFDRDVNDEVLTEIAKQKPYYAVFRDASFATDSVAANFEQIFATYSPSTVRKVL